ncbi:MAG: polyprenyl synthetase family protein [Bacillota bacterium]|nr:polyprenyl synthetase family protein [Bacillota bacterium]
MLSQEYYELKEIVDNHILDFMPEIDTKTNTLFEAMKYSLLAGGKRIRPILMLTFFKIASNNKMDISFAIPYAEAIEYIQTYSLIHDDLPAMDNDDYRRGKLTNHKVFGEDIAILAGDGLLSAAYEIMLKDSLLYLTDSDLLKRKVKASFELSKGTGVRGMIQGQVADVENEAKSCTAELLEFIDANKTGAFIKSSILVGCYLGGATKELLEDATVYGESLGHAFQIVDDIMDVISTKEERGKNVGGDATNEKNTYPSIYGIEESKKQALKLLEKAENSVSKYNANQVALDIVAYLKEQII